MTTWPAHLRFLLAFALAFFTPFAVATPSFPGDASKWNAVATFESIGVYWRPDSRTSKKASVRFRESGGDWREGHELWLDDRNTSDPSKHEYRGSLVELKPNTAYEIQLKVGDITPTNPWNDSPTLANCDGGASECRIPATASCSLTEEQELENSTHTRCTKTWNENFPIDSSKITEVFNRDTRLLITKEQSGSASGYRLFRPAPGEGKIEMPETVSGSPGDEGNCIQIEPGTRYVIIRGLNLKNCWRNGIFLIRRSGLPDSPTHHIVIEDNEISGWGNRPSPTALPYQDDGIHCQFVQSTPQNLRGHQFIIQRNRIHDPRHRTASWFENSQHAVGPRGMHFERCGGSNFVVRHNELWAGKLDSNNIPIGFEDAIGGNENLGQNGEPGFPGSDSDIYGNYLSDAYDDAIESEGINRNVRIWGNYMDRTYIGIANAATGMGPLYVWRNVTNRLDRRRNPFVQNPDNDDPNRGPFMKGAGNPDFTGGRAYYYHNTILQPPPLDGAQHRLGAGEGLGDSGGGGRLLYNFVSRNNVWHVWRGTGQDQLSGRRSIRTGVAAPLSDEQRRTIIANGDLYNGILVGLPEASETEEGTVPDGSGAPQEPDGIRGVPSYDVFRSGFSDYPDVVPSVTAGQAPVGIGNFRLASGSSGTSGVLAIPNFNDLEGSNPHVGAQRSSETQMKFGRAAATPSTGGPTAVLNTQPSSPGGTAPRQVTFTSASTPGSAPITSQMLNLGDGSAPIAIGSGVTHTYTSVQTYTATLTVSDGTNTDTDAVTFSVSASGCSGSLPTASFTATPSSGVKPLAVSFNASASTAVAPKTIASYAITYADGGSGTGVSQSHTYATAGQHIASLVVTDSAGCQSAPATRTITVTEVPGPVTVSLVQGQNGYAGTTDAQLAHFAPTTNWGEGEDYELIRESDSAVLIRFAIFQSEGGPVPNNATITSATLSLYKFWGAASVVKASRLLRNWNEAQTTWNLAATGTSWAMAGAQGSGTDYLATPDGQASIGDAAGQCATGTPGPPSCWLNLDVTSGVQAFRSGTPNYGWKLAYVSGENENSHKEFHSSESTSTTLRPKLTITYTVPDGTTVTLMQGLAGYAGTTDAQLAHFAPTTNWGEGEDYELIRESDSAVLIRYAVFQSEGGPVPNNATITSATLSLYKFWGAASVVKASRLLRNWNEAQTTWNLAATGTSWAVAGAQGSGTDYLTTPDGQASIGDAAGQCATGTPGPPSCWLNLDVTSGVQAFRSGTPNYGWKLAYVSGENENSHKEFHSSESTSTTLRPKLTLTYTTP